MAIKDKPQITKVTKPFVKWAGGKGSLVKLLSTHLPNDFYKQDSITYIEPFVGGGAMLFLYAYAFTNIHRVVINDVNKDLIFCYKLIKNNPQTLIKQLKLIEKEYLQLPNMDEKSRYYYKVRDDYNNRK